VKQYIKQQLIKALDKTSLKFNESLSGHTSFRIGGPAKAFYVAKTTEQLIKAVKLARNLKIPYFILGSGSNILVSDKGFKGIVIKLQGSGFRVQGLRIFAESGVLLSKLVKFATENSLSGLEFAAGIPGTLGGAIVGNSGAKTGSISDVIEKVTVLGKAKGPPWEWPEDSPGVKELACSNCRFSYRTSRFKKSGEVILLAVLKLKKAKKSEIKKRIKKTLESRKNQPWGKSAGCIFKNPKNKSAGVVIEQAGLKGQRVGDAEISKKHANFIINRGHAKASDVLELIALVKKKVWEKFKVRLEEEIVII